MADDRSERSGASGRKSRPAARRSGRAARTARASGESAKQAETSAKKPSSRSAHGTGGSTSKKRPASRRAKTADAPAKKAPAKKKKPVAKAKRAATSSVPPPGVQVEAEELETVAEESPNLPPDAVPVDARLHDIERNLDRLLDEADAEVATDPVARRRAAEALEQIAERLSPRRDRDEDPDASLFGTARELLSTDYYWEKWGRGAQRSRSEEVDDFGLDPSYEKRWGPVFELLYRKWFRTQTTGLEHVPASGRALLVANHSGTVPWDGVMLKTAIELEHSREELRWLAEDFVFHMPFLGAFMNRIGAVRACQENAERLLSQDKLVAVFPEGIKGIGKLFRQRYQLQRFGRGGYIKLALRTHTPIIPTAIIGAEETNPLLFKITHLTKGLGLPYVPVTPTFPWLGPLGLVPAPTQWRIVFGEPIDLTDHDIADAEDAILVNKLNERVRNTIQGMIDHALAQRTSVFFG